jgi:hypothetical protein
VRLARPAIPIALLCLVLAGCGGGTTVVVPDSPDGTAGLTISGGENLAPQATPTATPSATPTATTTGTSTSTGTTTQSAAPQPTATQAPAQGTAGGGTAAPTAQPTPPPGADAQKFEAFCQQNPGAC